MAFNQLHQIGCIKEEKKRCKDRALRNPTHHSRWNGARRAALHVLSAASEIGSQPVDHIAMETVGDPETFQKCPVINGVKGGRQIK